MDPMSVVDLHRSKRPVFFPVIHARTLGQARLNAAIAFENGADGIFLINHDIDYHALLDIYHGLRASYHTHVIGLNFLGINTWLAIQTIPYCADMLWVDSMGIADSERVDPELMAEHHWAALTERSWPGLYFGGVAFKYQPKVSDIRAAVRYAKNYTNVITTSGDATGTPPSVEKIRAMKSAAGATPLAVASGMSAENVWQFLPYVKYFLVATSISRSFDEFDPRKVRACADALSRGKKSP